jgi:chromosome partitioning protein
MPLRAGDAQLPGAGRAGPASGVFHSWGDDPGRFEFAGAVRCLQRAGDTVDNSGVTGPGHGVRAGMVRADNRPVHPIVLAVANQKGGVGKTTTTINVGAYLAGMGRRTLIVDADAQANATSGLGVDRSAVGATSYDVIVQGRPIADAVIPTMVPGLSLVPADLSLAGAEIEMIDLPMRERRLALAVEAVDDVDYVFIDCPPSLGLLTVNAAVAAEALLVPIQCEFYALEGLGLLTHTLALLRRDLNPNLRIAGIVMTLFDGRLALAHQVVDEVRSRFADELLSPLIPRNVRLSEAPSHGLPVNLYDPTCRGAIAYGELAANLDRRLAGQAQAVLASAMPGGDA